MRRIADVQLAPTEIFVMPGALLRAHLAARPNMRTANSP